MEPNLTARYIAIETERARLPLQAERGWLVEQAVAMQPQQTAVLTVRRWIGGVLIVTGQRMQGRQEAAVMPMDAAHAQ